MLRIESYDVIKPKSGKPLKYDILALLRVFQLFLVWLVIWYLDDLKEVSFVDSIMLNL